MTDKSTPDVEPAAELDDELEDDVADTAAVTCRVETAMLGWAWAETITVERTDYVDLLIAGGRLTVLAPDAG